MRILVAPNAFKHAITATEAADAICRGLRQSRLAGTFIPFPVGDGGDGTGDLVVQHLKGRLVKVKVHDPLGREIEAGFGLIGQDKIAVIELASASGIRLLTPGELAPLHANTFGTGEQIRHALDLGVTRIILCVGGSATVDGGTGIFRALGAKFHDGQKELHDLPFELSALQAIDLSSLDQRLFAVELAVLCDVNNPLLGDEGAAAVFGPQKGASPADVRLLETGLHKYAEIIGRTTGTAIQTTRHGGAAGGVAAGLHAMAGATLVNGIDYFMKLTGLENAVKQSDLVITGEGAIDEQTLQGKAPCGVAEMAKKYQVPVICLAGKIPLENRDAFDRCFDELLAINPATIELAEALKNTAVNLAGAAERLGNRLAETGYYITP